MTDDFRRPGAHVTSLYLYVSKVVMLQGHDYFDTWRAVIFPVAPFTNMH